MEPIKIDTSCKVAKKMTTDRVTKNDVEIVTCSTNVGVIRMAREVAEQLAGYPVDAWRNLYDTKGYPVQRTGLLFPKRELIADFKIEHRRDSGAAISSLKVPLATVTSLQFSLDAPDDQGECAIMQFHATWKAAGDEVEDVEALLGRPCHILATFKEPPQQGKMFSDSKPSTAAEKAAKTRLDRKSQAAGEKLEKPGDVEPPDALLSDAKRFVGILECVSLSELQSQLKIGYNRAARIMEQLVTAGVLGDPTPGDKAMTRVVLEKAAPLSPVAAVVADALKDPKVREYAKGELAKGAKTKGEPLVGKNFERDARDKAARNPRRDSVKPKPRGKH